MSSTDKIVGVIGGLGPQATADFFNRIIRNTEASSDQDHLHVLIDNNPKAPNRNHAIAGLGPSPEASFAQSAKRLEQAGAEILVMPCNTAHAFQRAITEAANVPFVSIVTETCGFIHDSNPKPLKVGVLAVDGCLKAGLYQSGLEEVGIEVLTLPKARQVEFMELVYSIKSSGVSAHIKQTMKTMASELEEIGAEAILAGCTEVPLVLVQNDLLMPLYDSTEILAQKVVKYAKGTLPLG